MVEPVGLDLGLGQRPHRVVHLNAGRVTSATDPSGRQVSYGYDTGGNLTTVVEVGGQVWTYGYDSAHRLTSKVDPRGGTVTNHYDSAGRVDVQTNEVGGTTSFDYTTIPDATKVTDPRGMVRVDYYVGGQLTAQTLAHGTPEAGTWSYAYDPLTSAQIRKTDPAGRSTRRTVDAHGNPLTVTDPAGHTTTASYNSFDQPLSTTNGAGETTTHTYDSAGNILTVTRPHAGGQTATTTYTHGDSANPGDVTAITDPLGHTTDIAYDTNGYRNAVADPLGNTATWSYDNVGRLTGSVTPRGNELGADSDDYRSTYQSDAYGHTTSVTDPLGRTSTATYLPTGQVATATDPLGMTTTHTYDLAGRRTATTRPDSTTIGTGYDAAGNITSQTDGAGAAMTYTYNARNQVASSTDPAGRTNTSAYDTSGRLATTTDAATLTVTYHHDPAGRVTGVDYSSATTPDVAYAYDAAGRRTTMVDGTGTTSYTYDSAGRLASYTNGTGQSLGYGYDLAGRETTITYPGSRTLTRSYDTADRLAGVTDWAARTISFGYDADSNLTQIGYPNSVTTTSGYDQGGQLESIGIANTSGPLASFAYTHRDDDLLATQALTGIPGAGTEALGYDPNSRLSAVNTDTYGYDTADNPTLLANTAQQFNVANELCWTASAPTTDVCASPPTGATTYTYDARGNRASRITPTSDVTAYAYDQANRLTAVTLNGNTIGAYAYDGDGLRRSKTLGSTTTHQLWDTNAELPLLALDGTDAYITGPSGQPLARIDAADTPTYIHSDRQGSTRLLTDNTGTATGTYTYDAWGNTLNHTGTTSLPLQYNGQYTDTETGLQYLRARYYDPRTGQFLSQDPLHLQTRSTYGYAFNSPLNGGDPTGLAPEDQWTIDSEYRDNSDRYVPLRVGYALPSDGHIQGWGWSKIWSKHAPWWDL